MQLDLIEFNKCQAPVTHQQLVSPCDTGSSQTTTVTIQLVIRILKDKQTTE